MWLPIWLAYLIVVMCSSSSLSNSKSLSWPHKNTLFFVVGITETIAQLISGWVTDRNLFHKYHYHKAYLILCGLVNLLSPLATSYILLMVYAVFFAIFCGGYMALLLPVLVRKPPLENQHCGLMTRVARWAPWNRTFLGLVCSARLWLRSSRGENILRTKYIIVISKWQLKDAFNLLSNLS